MTLRFAESLDWLPASTTAALQGRGYTAGGAVNRVAGRINGFAAQMAGGGEFANSFSRPIPGAAMVSGYIGFTFKVPGWVEAGLGTQRFLSLRDGSTNHLGLRFAAGQSIMVQRDTIVLGTTSSLVFGQNTWHRGELYWLINDTTGAYELRIDGAAVLAGSNVDTRNGASAQVTHFIIGGGNINGVAPIFDDITINDTLGSVNNGFMGDLHIEQLLPNSDDSVAWARSTGATNYGCVDEAGLDATDYVSAATAGLIDRYGLTDLSDNPTTVFAVQTLYSANKDNTGDCTVRANVVSGASVGNGAANALNTTTLTNSDILETDPQGGGAWTGARVNAARFEIERVS